MTAVLIIIVSVLVLGFFRGILQGRQNLADAEAARIASANLTPDIPQELNNENETKIMEDPKLTTRQLMVTTLTQIGCQPTVNEDETVDVTYQGEHFRIDFGGVYAQIWDLGWAGVSIDDPELPKIREAINSANFNFGPTVVMTSPDSNGTMYFHSRLGILLHPSLPALDEYLRSNLNLFFKTKDSVRQNFQQINIDQQKAHEKRRVVGFATTQDSEEAPEQ